MNPILNSGSPAHATDGQDRGSAIEQEMIASTRVLQAAHDAHVRDAIDNVIWERRGVLQRLTRRDR